MKRLNHAWALAATLLVTTSGCWLIGSTPGGAGPTGAASSSSPGAPGAEGGIDEGIYAPPAGLPDMRPIIGLDPGHWAPAFMPAVTQQMVEADVLPKLRGFKQVEVSDGDVKFISLVPADASKLAGLRAIKISFHKGDDGQHHAYGVDLEFTRGVRFQPAFKEYLVHLCRLNYGPIDDQKAAGEIITIFGGDGSAQLTDHDDGVALSLTFPKKQAKSEGVPQPKAPAYSAVVPINEADYAPPAGKPDARKWMGVDPDHWAPAFLPAIRQGLPEKEALSLLETHFEVKKKPAPGDSAFVELVPKQKDLLPGIKRVQIYLTSDERWAGRGLRSLSFELEDALTKDKDYMAYLVRLGNVNFSSKKKPDPSEGTAVWPDDHGGMAQLSELSFEYTFPYY